ncbi:helix-turn-helix domain-containing protein [Scandinavium goeteborgense]|uniref:helix-turn-helix domain-containing protein n=1 Tax=Scandinavium goeteborgense TaxID=1851514 RepID=UPI00135B3875|nr:helix-turn-helix transcriptional regulator [Scandinavium goeteborgense]MCS2153227.1 helix-turn-helix domain-containing protein [Scandinavium goeteborgense]
MATNFGSSKEPLIGIENFGNRLRHLIGNDSVSSFAKSCGISTSTINKYIKPSKDMEKPTYPGIDKVLKISACTGYSLAWLITGEEEKQVSNEEQQKRWMDVFKDMSSDQKLIALESFKQKGILGTLDSNIFNKRR